MPKNPSEWDDMMKTIDSDVQQLEEALAALKSRVQDLRAKYEHDERNKAHEIGLYDELRRRAGNV